VEHGDRLNRPRSRFDPGELIGHVGVEVLAVDPGKSESRVGDVTSFGLSPSRPARGAGPGRRRRIAARLSQPRSPAAVGLDCAKKARNRPAELLWSGGLLPAGPVALLRVMQSPTPCSRPGSRRLRSPRTVLTHGSGRARCRFGNQDGVHDLAGNLATARRDRQRQASAATNLEHGRLQSFE